MNTTDDRPIDFQAQHVNTADNTVFVRRYGQGPAILIVHGFPRTSLMWRHIAPTLAMQYTVICADLRGYGKSGIPPSTDDHYPYTKRAMANELVEVMAKLGFSRFSVVGHDRGGRVSYRLALDHPEQVDRLAVFDVVPISEAWGHADAKFAMTYWPWSLLSQKAPLPETYLTGAPEAVFHNPFGEGSFGADILREYLETFRDPARVHAICEEYRAAATLDIEHDQEDRRRSRRIACPMLHLWATGGPLDTFYGQQGGPLDTFYGQQGGPLGIWRNWAERVSGQAVTGGHFFPEENPVQTAELLAKFLAAR